MDKLLIKKTSECLDDLIDYVNKCNFDNYILYSKVSTTFSYLGALFGSRLIKEPVNDIDMLKNACVAFNNAFKHSKELKRDYNDLNLLEYGTALNCILDAPFGDVVFFRNAEYLKELNDKRNYKWYSEVLEGKRMDFILNEIRKIVGDMK